MITLFHLAFVQNTGFACIAIRINAGDSTDYTDCKGNVWSKDQEYTDGSYGYVGGNTYWTSHLIDNTSDDRLYQSSRWGLSAYRFDLPNGLYTIKLMFAEIYFGVGTIVYLVLTLRMFLY